MAGIGYQKREYKGFPHSNGLKRSNSMSSEDDDLWDESSSVKVDASQKQRILYIQVCITSFILCSLHYQACISSYHALLRPTS